MSDEQDQVRTLRAEVDRLTTRLQKAEGEATRRKAAMVAVGQALGVTNAAELRDVVGELAKVGGYRKLATEVEQLRKATPEQLKREHAEAVGKLRTLAHRDGIKALYGDLGINPQVPVERLMGVMNYLPDGDQFDAEAVKGKIAALKTSDPYLFGTGATAGDQSQPAPPAWAGRGASGQSAPGANFTEAQLRDPEFMLREAPKMTALKS
jgi:hypothetical protein